MVPTNLYGQHRGVYSILFLKISEKESQVVEATFKQAIPVLSVVIICCFHHRSLFLYHLHTTPLKNQ